MKEIGLIEKLSIYIFKEDAEGKNEEQRMLKNHKESNKMNFMDLSKISICTVVSKPYKDIKNELSLYEPLNII